MIPARQGRGVCSSACAARAADGHDYAKAAGEAGCCAVLAERPVGKRAARRLFLVSNTREALAELSAAFFGRPAEELRVVGITGTKGKTTTAHMVRAILEEAGIPTGMIGTIGIDYGETHVNTVNTTPESYEIQKALRAMLDAGLPRRRAGGLLHRPAGSPPRFAPVLRRGIHEFLGGSHWRRRAQGYGGIPGLQEPALSKVRDGRRQRGRSRVGGRNARPYVRAANVRLFGEGRAARV